MDVSVVIVNYNGGKFLRDCIASLYESAMTLDQFEVIVVDNASTDDSVDALRNSHWPIQLIENKENRGFSTANNQGAAVSAGRYVFLLNNDTVVEPTTISTLMTYCDSHPNAGIVGPRLLNGDGTLQAQGSVLMKWKYTGDQPRSVAFITGAAMMIPRQLYLDIGGLDEHYFFYNEDLDICKTMQKLGRDIVYLPSAQLIHFGGLSTETRKKGSIIEGYRGGLYFCKKHYGPLVYKVYQFVLFFDLIPRYLWHMVHQIWNPAHSDARKAYQEIMGWVILGDKRSTNE